MSFAVPSWDKATTDVTTHHIEGFAHMGGSFSMSLITPVIGNLWQGGCIDGLSLSEDFDFVVSLYPWEKYKIWPRTFRVEVELYDSNDMPDADQLYTLAKVIRAFMRTGKTLVHCQAGLNRSGLLSGLALILDGWDAERAIQLLRDSRSQAVLCNSSFEGWLREQKTPVAAD